MMWYVSAVSLGTIMLLCFVGTFYCKYDDNLFQRVGMFLVFIGSWPRFAGIVENQSLAPTPMAVEASMSVHIGLAVFALGTAFKVWKFRHDHVE